MSPESSDRWIPVYGEKIEIYVDALARWTKGFYLCEAIDNEKYKHVVQTEDRFIGATSQIRKKE